MQVEIIRVETGSSGTFGILKIDGKMFCITLEPPNLNNEKGISCIPEGEYKCSEFISPKFGKCFEIKNVPNRDNILFHYGNNINDTHGCILIGLELALSSRQILKSMLAWESFKSIVGKEFDLKITSTYM